MVLSRETRISAFYTNIEVWHKIVCIFWAEYTKIRGKSLAKVRAAASQLARVFHVGVFLENTDASLAVACLCANISGATAQRRLRVAGIQGVLDPLARFLGSFFAARQRMNTIAAQRTRTKCSVSVKRRRLLKSPAPRADEILLGGSHPHRAKTKRQSLS